MLFPSNSGILVLVSQGVGGRGYEGFLSVFFTKDGLSLSLAGFGYPTVDAQKTEAGA